LAHQKIITDKKTIGLPASFYFVSVIWLKLNEMKELLERPGFETVLSKECSETETIPHGRPEVKLIWYLARKG
jgi:hypothetical protein